MNIDAVKKVVDQHKKPNKPKPTSGPPKPPSSSPPKGPPTGRPRHPATGSQWQRPQRGTGATPPRPPKGSYRSKPRKERPSTQLDYKKVQAYLPKHVRQEHPIKSIPSPGHRPAVEVERFEMAPPRRGPKPTSPPVILKGGNPAQKKSPYKIADEPQPEPHLVGKQATGQTIADDVSLKWRQAKEAVNKSGRGDYRPVRGLGDIFHNIGQWDMGANKWTDNKGFGSGFTGLWEGFKLVGGVPAEAIERAGGDYYYSDVTPLREELGVGDDPVKNKAFSTALGVTYSGRGAVKDAYDEALQLAEQDQLSPENTQINQARHGIWWRELVGQSILDPLNFLDVASVGGKVIRNTKWAAGADRMFLNPLTDDAGKLLKTDEVVKGIKNLGTRATQFKEADNLIDSTMAFVSPRLASGQSHRVAERTGQVVTNITGINKRRAMLEVSQSGINPGTPEFAQAVTVKTAENTQNTAMLWAQLADDNVENVERAAQALKQLGYGDIPKSVMGRRTGVVLKELMSKGDGEYRSLVESLGIAKEQGLGPEVVASQWYDKAAKIFDNLIESGPKPVEGGLVKVSEKINRAKQPIDNAFSALFMGYNPGYALRNFYDNTGTMIVQNYSPLKPLHNLGEKIGIPVIGGERGVGSVERSTQMPFTKLAEKFEQWGSRRVADQAQVDALNQIWPQAIRDLDIPAEYAPIIRDLAKRDINWLDKIADSDVVIDAWRHVDDATVDAMNSTDPHLHEHLVKILDDSEDPLEAVTKLRELQEDYIDHVATITEKSKPYGHAEGTLTGKAIDLAMQSTEFTKPGQLDDLAEQLSGLEHSLKVSRNQTMKSISSSVDPDKWSYKLSAAEDAYNSAVDNIAKRQITGFTRLINGEITKEVYKKHLISLYRKAYNDLDNVYSRILNAAGGEIPQEMNSNTLRWLLQREAYQAGYPSTVIKETIPNAEDVMNPKLIRGEVVQDAHFGNKIRAILKGKIPPKELQRIKTINDLTDAEIPIVINAFRKQRGLKPMSPEELLQLHRGRASATGGGFPLETLRPYPDEADMLQVREGLKANQSGEAVAATAAAQSDHLLVGPSADGMDTTYTTANQSVQLLDGIIDDLIERAQNPPMTGAGLPPETIELLRQRYFETHTRAAEMARRARDFALLDYKDRRTVDVFLKNIFPWHYWFSRKVPNWLATWASRPALGAHYMKLKRELREHNTNDPNIPEWAKENLVIRPPGFEGAMYLDWESAFNSIATITETFEDPDKEKTALGETLSRIGNFGPAVHPLLLAAYAAERGIQGDTEGMRSYGYLSGQTRTFASLTGKTLEPWLWLKDPETGERLPFTGGSKWDINKATRRLGHKVGEGEYTPEEGILGAATHTTDPYVDTLVDDIQRRYRIPSVLASTLLGLRITTREGWEDEVTDTTNEYYQAKESGNEAKAQRILDERPEMGAIWMSWDNETTRMGMLADNVLARIPPMPGEDRAKLLNRVGLTEPLMDLYYRKYDDSPGNEINDLSDFDQRDYNQFIGGVINLAEILGLPDRKTAQEWREARTQQREIYERMDKKFPGIQESQAQFFQLMETDPEAAQEYKKTTDLDKYWNALNHELLGNPLVLQYYQEPMKVDTIAESMAYDTINRKYPNLEQVKDAYYRIPDDDWKAKREFRRQHPEVVGHRKELDELIDRNRQELRNLREYTTEGTKTPKTIDYIIDGKPTAAQVGALEHIEEMEIEAAKPLPPEPEKEPDKFSPQEQEYFQTRDEIYSLILDRHPGYYDLERQYDRVKELHGDDAAKLFAKNEGLYDIRDEMRLLEVENPVTIAEMSKEDIQWAAKAATRREREKMFPGIDELWNDYYSLPKGPDRRKFWDEHPNLMASIEWKKSANPEQHFYNRYMNRRAKALQQRKATTATPSGESAPDVSTSQSISEMVEPEPEQELTPANLDPAVSSESNLPTTDLAKVRNAIRAVESGNNYQAQNSASSASGGYGYINSTWGNYGDYATAKEAPQDIQDAKMMEDLKARHDRYGGDIEKIIAAHYYPAWANDKSKWNQKPTPDQITLREYVDRVLSKMS